MHKVAQICAGYSQVGSETAPGLAIEYVAHDYGACTFIGYFMWVRADEFRSFGS